MQCDEIPATALGLGQYDAQSFSHNPFTSFAIARPVERNILVESVQEVSMTQSTEQWVDPFSLIPPTMTLRPDTAPEKRLLFHHYVSHVAIIMIPYEHARNPWKLYYPATALCRTAPDEHPLYNAMLAQAAFNLACLRGHDDQMPAIGSRYRELAVQQLIGNDRLGDDGFGALVATIMTLVFAEVDPATRKVYAPN